MEIKGITEEGRVRLARFTQRLAEWFRDKGLEPYDDYDVHDRYQERLDAARGEQALEDLAAEITAEEGMVSLDESDDGDEEDDD